MKFRALRYALLLTAIFGIVFLLRAALPTVATGTWVAVGNMAAARSGACSAALSDGRLLISGGADANGPTATADLFSTTGTWSAAAQMSSPRSHQSCALLQDGRVLVAGGTSSGGGITNSAELYDPTANSWTQAGNMNDARSGATTSVLQDGRVLIAGGQSSGGALNTLEIFDPTSGTFSNAGTMSSPRQDHAAAVLSDGRVLIAGGFDGTNPLASSDIFDPSSGTVSAGPNLATARYAHSATTLLNGQVVVIGGAGAGTNGTVDLASAEIFDPSTGAFTTASATLTTAREGHLAFLLPKNNSVLIVGGTSSGATIAASEVFTPQVSSSNGAWTYATAPAGSNVTPRSAATGSPMQQDGLLLAAGGTDASGNTLASAELYAFATVKTDQADYPPGTTVNINGSGFTPGETVTITLVESPLFDTHGPYTITAQQDGTISDSSFTTDIHDVNVRFWLSAVGSKSGSQALNTFTDAAGDTPTNSVSCTANTVTAGTPISCTATSDNSAGANGAPQGIMAFSYNGPGGTFTFSPTQCSVAQVGSTKVSNCSVTFTANAVMANGKVQANFNSNDTNLWKNGNPGSFNVTVNAGGFSQLQLLVPGENAAPGTATGKTGTPTAHTAGTAFNVTVNAVDANWNPVSSSNTVHITSSDTIATLPANAALVGGTQTFSVTLRTAPLQTITASDFTDGTKASSISPAIPVNAAAANKLAFSQQPTDSNLGATIAPAIIVQVQDQFGNVVTTSSASTTLSIKTGTGTSGAVLACTTGLSHNASSGVATFPDCNINKAGTNYQLHAAATGVTAADSNTFTIISPISKLGFTTAPFTGIVNQCLGPITVQTQNSGGTGINPSTTVQVDLSITSGGTGAFFSDSSCAAGITNASIPTSANSANFFFKVTSAGSPVVQAADHAGVLSSATQTETINRAATTTTVTSSSNPSTYGASPTFTAMIAPASGSTVPTGTVQFKIDGVSVGSPVAVSACSPSPDACATFTPTAASLPVAGSPHSITAVYSGDSMFATSASNTISQTVSPAVLTYTANPASRAYGVNNPVFTGTVTGFAPGDTQASATTGTLVFTSPATSSSNVGSYAINGAGLTANNGNYTFVQAASNATALSITQATPTVAFTGAPASAYFNSQFTVSTSTNASTTAAITASGSCTIAGSTVTMTSGLSVCSLQANWPADTNYIAATAMQSTNALQISVSVSVPTTTVVYDGTPKGVTPTVTPAVAYAVTYTGISPTVYATSSSAPTEPGSYMVAATVTDPNYTGSGSGTLTITQKDPALALTLRTGMPEPSPYGSRVYFELLTANSPCPTGQVQFFVDSDNTASSTVNLSSSPCTSQPIEFSTATLQPGTHTVYAVYSGDTYYLAENSSPVSHQVVADGTSVTLATSAMTVFVGDPVTLTATVTLANSIDGSATPPSGTVQFYDNTTTLLDESALSSNTAMFTVLSLPAGSHSITATYVSANGDFSGSSSPVSVETVDQITPTINWPNPADIFYGTKLSATQLNATATDAHKSNNPIAGTFTYNPPADTVLAVGSLNLMVTFTPDDAATYTNQTTTATINVKPATLTVTPDDASRYYGADNPTFTFKYSGFVNSETSSIVTTPPTCSSAANSSSSIGTYDITCSGAVAPNYTITYASGKLTVNPALLTITAQDATKQYGQTLAFTGIEFTPSGLVNSDKVTSVTLTSAGTAATASVGGSPYSVVPSAAVGTGLSNYTISYVNGKLTANPALLTITANDQTKAYGTTPTLGSTAFTPSGLLNSDTVASVTLTSAGTAATATVAGSPYDIVPSAAVGTGLGNYTISYKNGNLTVNPATLTLSVTGASGIYNALPYLAACSVATGLVNGDSVTLTTIYSSGMAPVNVGSYTATCTSSGNSNYQTASGQTSIIITPAMLTIAADNQSMTFGGNAPTFTATYTGFQGLDGPNVLSGLTFTVRDSGNNPVTDFTTLKSGSYPIVASGASALNYTVQYLNGTLTVNKAPLAGSVTISAVDPATVPYGQPVTATVNLNSYSIGGVPVLQKHADPNNQNQQLPESLTVYLVPANGGPSQAVKFGTATAVPTYDNTNNTTGTIKTGWIASITAPAPTPGNYNAFVYGDDPGDNSLTNLQLADAGYWYPDTSDISYPTLQSKQLDVVPAALTITANNANKNYGLTLSFLGNEFTTSGLVNSDKVTSVTLTSAGAAATATVTAPGPTYAIVPSAAAGTGLSNYTISYKNGTLTLSPALLTITANNVSKTYGLPLTFSGTEFTPSGTLYNGDTVTGVTLSSTGAAGTATVTSPGPNYPIMASAAAGSGLENYTISYVRGTLCVKPAPLTVTANSTSKAYGSILTFAGTEFTSSTLYNGDSVTSVTLTSAGSAATATVAGSPYAITPSAAVGTGLGNYTISYVNGALTVTKAHLTVTAYDQNRFYGDANPAFTATITGFMNGETLLTSGVTGAAYCTTAATATSPASPPTYPITCTVGTLMAANYDFTTFNPGQLTVNKRLVTVTADPQTKIYGSVDPGLTYKVTSGSLVNGDMFTGALSRVAGENVGNYAIQQNTLALSGNYSLTYTGANLTITPAPLTITASSAMVNYGAPVPAITGSYMGFVNGDTPASLATAPNCTTAAHGSPSGSPVGSYAANCYGAVDGNYAISYTPGTITIQAVPLTITASGPTVNYGSAVPAITASYMGFVNGDTPASLTTAPTCTTAAHGSPSASPVGSYATNCSGAVDSNYVISYTPGTATIQAVSLTITASSPTANYGSAVPAITASYSGFVNGDSSASLTTQPVCTTAAHGPPSGSAAGSYATNCSGATDSNYAISYTPGAATIQAVPLTITANSGSMIYGGPVFPVTPMYSGFVNGDTFANLTTQPTCWTTATSLSPVAPYGSSCSGALDNNYIIGYVAGAVTVMPASTTTAVVSSVNPSTFMQLVTFTATVLPQYAGTTPTGTVAFYNNGSQIGTGTLSAASCGVPPCPDQATFNTSSLPDSGPDSITAVYGGDTNFITSTSAPLSQAVQPSPNVSLAPMFVSFGNLNVGQHSSMNVTLANIGDATLNISSGGISTTPPFTQTNNCGSSLAPSKSCTITITFTPVDTGIQTASLQITDNDDDSTNAQQTVSLTGAGLSTISGGSLFTDALFATANGCGSIIASGGSTVDSFSSALGYSSSHVLSGGNVGTNGNVTLNGGKSMIYGSAAVDTMLTGNCSKTSLTGITTSGGAQVTGGAVALNGPITYPAPPTSPAPLTTTQNISGSCGSISGCTNIGTKTVSLAPGQYGNLSLSGGTTAHLSMGTYNINSLTLSGNSILYVDSGPVVVNLAGASLNGGNPAMDASGGSIQNPTGKPSNLQFAYAGSRGLTLSGGSWSYATVYAPNALVNMSGGSDFFGSIIGSTVTASGGTAMHGDSSLADIQPGNTIWFTAVVNNVAGLPSSGNQVKLYLTNSSIQFTGGGVSYNVPVPNAVVTFNSAVQSSGAKTIYDLTNNRWSTAVAKGGLTGSTFVAGIAFQVPSDFPTGIQNATWSASFSTDTPGVNLQWQWGAAVYTSLNTCSYAASTNCNALGVNAEDGSVGSDPAGTPESYKTYVTFGATGGGLTNYTGYRSSAAAVVPTIAPMSVSPSSLDFVVAQNQGTTSSAMTAVLSNNDSVQHNISVPGIQISGTNAADFILVPNGPSTPNNCLSMASLGSGASCTLYATFTPGDVGTRTAKIVLNDDANNSPQTVYLSGTGQ